MSTIKRGAEFLLVFELYDVSAGELMAGAAGLAATVSNDGGGLGASDNVVAEIGGGLYSLQLSAGEMAADRVDVKVTATDARAMTAHITTEALTNEDLLTVPIADYEDAAAARSLLWAIAKLANNVQLTGSTLRIKKTDDTTDLFTQAVTTNPSQEPVVGVDTA